MGRKGVSKRKPKKTTSHSNKGASDFINDKNKGHSPVQSLVSDKGAPLNKGGNAPTAGTNKAQK